MRVLHRLKAAGNAPECLKKRAKARRINSLLSKRTEADDAGDFACRRQLETTSRSASRTGSDGSSSCEGSCSRGEDALGLCLTHHPDAILMDVQLEGAMNGIQSAVAIRREFPRMPIVFYSIQDDDTYYRDFAVRAF
jgi:CheY-like chemotaxis protein